MWQSNGNQLVTRQEGSCLSQAQSRLAANQSQHMKNFKMIAFEIGVASRVSITQTASGHSILTFFIRVHLNVRLLVRWLIMKPTNILKLLSCRLVGARRQDKDPSSRREISKVV